MTLRDDLTIFFHRLSDHPAESFADVFLSGDKDGIKPVTRQAVLKALPKRAKMFREAGVGEPTLASLSFEALDERFIPCLESSYLLHRMEDGTMQVVVYLNHKGL